MAEWTFKKSGDFLKQRENKMVLRIIIDPTKSISELAQVNSHSSMDAKFFSGTDVLNTLYKPIISFLKIKTELVWDVSKIYPNPNKAPAIAISIIYYYLIKKI